MKNNTRKQFYLIILSVFVIIFISSFLFASVIYPGETKIYNNDLGLADLDYVIVNNNTYIGELSVSINSANISITFPGDLSPGSFDIVFIERDTKEVVQYVSVGGGGGGTRTKYINVTEYKNITKYVDKIIESEPKTIIQQIKEYTPSSNKNIYVMVSALMLLPIALLIWNIKRIRGNSNYNTMEKEVEKNE